MKQLSLYRRRLIPAECLHLHDDTILYCGDGILVTAWKTIRPKKDLNHGFSCYYLKEGYKVSEFYRADHTLLYCYCDIISPFYRKEDNALIVTDLLADVIVYPDGFIKVLDLDEMADAFRENLLSPDMLQSALLSLHRLLERLYAGQLPDLLSPIKHYAKTAVPGRENRL